MGRKAKEQSSTLWAYFSSSEQELSLCLLYPSAKHNAWCEVDANDQMKARINRSLCGLAPQGCGEDQLRWGQKHCKCLYEAGWIGATQSGGHSPAATAQLGYLPECKLPSPTPEPLKHILWVQGPGIWILTSLSGDFPAQESLRNTGFHRRSKFLMCSVPLFVSAK